MLKFDVTFEVITPESAEHGEAESMGYEAEKVSLREAIDAMGQGEQGMEASEYPVSNPRWITAYDTNRDRAYWEQGESVNRSLHFPDTMTASSKLRVCRLLGVYGVNQEAQQ
jgi:hypothetical protein